MIESPIGKELRVTSTPTIRERRHEASFALIAAMTILALVVTLAITAMETTQRDQQVAGVQARSRVALQAAEAGLSLIHI